MPWFTEPYDSGRMHQRDSELVFLRHRPRRDRLAFLTRHYELLVAALVSVIVVASGLPHAPTSTLVATVLYGLYFGVQAGIYSRFRGRRQLSEAGQVTRALAMVAGASALVFVVYWHAERDSAQRPFDGLWLLYLLPIFLVSQRGVATINVGVVTGGALVAMWALSFRAATDTGWPLVQTLTIKSLWIVLIAVIVHTLVRAIGERSANLNVLHELYTKTAAVRTVADESAVLQKLAADLAGVFHGYHVNVLLLQPDGRLTLRALSNCPDQVGHDLPPDSKGIVRYVIQQDKGYFTNRAETDPHFQPSPSFPKTRSELTVPIRIGGRVIGVLDVQSDTRDAFRRDDLILCESVAAYVGSLLDNMRMAESYQKLGTLMSSIARRFVSDDELEQTLSSVAKAAHAELGPDVVILYERNALTDTVRWGGKEGTLFEPDAIDQGPARRESSVERFIASPEPARFDEDILDEPTAHRGFVEREGIRSRATLKLLGDSGVVGLMFLNYRSRTTFDLDTKARCQAFAVAAALVIQKAQAQERKLQRQQEGFVRTLHDEMKAKLFGLARLVNSVRRDVGIPDERRNSLDVAFEAATELWHTVDDLVSKRQDLMMNDLKLEIERLIRFTRHSHPVDISLDWPNCAVVLPPAMVRELKLVVSEAVSNAANHGAERIDVSAEVDGEDFECVVADSGPGFDPAAETEGRGLLNMSARAKWLGGTVTVRSKVGGRTQIIVRVPMTGPPGIDDESSRMNDAGERVPARRSA